MEARGGKYPRNLILSTEDGKRPPFWFRTAAFLLSIIDQRAVRSTAAGSSE